MILNDYEALILYRQKVEEFTNIRLQQRPARLRKHTAAGVVAVIMRKWGEKMLVFSSHIEKRRSSMKPVYRI